MLAADDRRTQAYAEKDRLSAAQGQAYAAHLPGYDRLIRHFHVRQAKLADFWQGFSFSASLDAAVPQTIDSFRWLDPVNKAHKARYNWNQFLPIAAHVERLARQHPWLRKWKAAGPHRRIEAQMYGKISITSWTMTSKRTSCPPGKTPDSGESRTVSLN